MKYFNNFNNIEDVLSSFGDRDNNGNTKYNIDVKEEEILLASYGGSGYEGDAVVIFHRDGKYYEVHGSHCSCNGLEGQWQPEETSMEALAYRLENMDENSLKRLEEEHGDEFLEAFRALTVYEIFEREVLMN